MLIGLRICKQEFIKEVIVNDYRVAKLFKSKIKKMGLVNYDLVEAINEIINADQRTTKIDKEVSVCSGDYGKIKLDNIANLTMPAIGTVKYIYDSRRKGFSCICETNQLMLNGCTCGSIERFEE